MNKYTILVQADKLKSIIPIPSEFEHKEVEIMISLPKKEKFNPQKFRGVCNESKESIDKKLKHMRMGWDRSE